MRIFATFVLASLTFLCACRHNAGLSQPPRVLELPCPNSGKFTFEEAGAKKYLILSNTPSKPLADWKNPFMGFAVHVNANDTFTVYSLNTWHSSEGVHTNKPFTVAGIKELVLNSPQLGNPHGILITSDRSLSESKTFPALLDALFEPYIQLFYLSAK
jgi:hypothetical protein